MKRQDAIDHLRGRFRGGSVRKYIEEAEKIGGEQYWERIKTKDDLDHDIDLFILAEEKARAQHE